ncbi:MAG: tetratricopeptide repeat protein [Terriglobales bacterium]
MPENVENLVTNALQARREGRSHDARRDLIAAVDLCRQAPAPADLARALADLGQIERDLGRLDAALKHYEEAAAIYRAQNNLPRLAHTIRHIGDIHRSAGHPALAEPCYEEALILYRNDKQTTPLDLANAIRGFAILKSDAGDSPKAIALWTEARDLYRVAAVNEGVAESSRRLALLTGNESSS